MHEQNKISHSIQISSILFFANYNFILFLGRGKGKSTRLWVPIPYTLHNITVIIFVPIIYYHRTLCLTVIYCVTK